MAEEHNALKYSPAISKGVARVLGGAYGEVGVSRVSESIVVMADIWRQPEWAYPRDERLFARLVEAPAVALRFAGIQLINPSGSGMITVVESLKAEVEPGFGGDDLVTQLDTGGDTATNPVTVRGVGRDGRLFTGPAVVSSRCTLVSGDFAAGANTPQDRLDANNATGLTGGPYVLTPGTKLFVFTVAVAQAAVCSFFWRERQAFPGEL